MTKKKYFIKKYDNIVPIIFGCDKYKEQKIIDLFSELDTSSTYVYTFAPNLAESSVTKTTWLTSSRVLRSPFHTFYGGIILHHNLVNLIVNIVDKGTFVIIEKEFSVNYPSLFNKLKKFLRDNNILNRKNLVMADRLEIINNFLQVLNPTIEDFGINRQHELSVEFLKNCRLYKEIIDEKETIDLENLPF